MASEAIGAVKTTLTVASMIYSQIEGMSENDEHCQKIKRQLKTLEGLVDGLKTGPFPESAECFIILFQDSIEKCKQICKTFEREHGLKKLVFAKGNQKKLENLEKELQKATDNLQIALQTVSLAQGTSTQQQIESGIQKVEKNILHPKAGVYNPGGKKSLRRPHQIKELSVNLNDDGDMMQINWSDDQNDIETINKYEIRYDEENNMVVAKKPEKLMRTGKYDYSILLGDERLNFGQLYTVQVRATNGQGPGAWSEGKKFRFRIGPPNKPQKPNLTVKSPTEVVVETKKLTEEEENGSPVTHCIVEYTDRDDTNAASWNSLTSPIKQSYIKLSIKPLKPGATYHFRIKMVNGVGESPVSVSNEIKTTYLIPGAPENLRISSKRTSTSIKIRWDKPVKNPEAAFKYRAEMRRAKPGDLNIWEAIPTNNTKMSAKATELKTDTRYQFRVKAINEDNIEGSYCEEVEAETRYGIFGRIVGTTAATVGGTVGGPVLGATGLGAAAGMSAAKIPDSSTGKAAIGIPMGIAAGVGGAFVGLIGAPVLGAVAGAMVYKKMTGKLEDISPQTSDDEEEEVSAMTSIFKHSMKVSDDMFSDKKSDKKK